VYGSLSRFLPFRRHGSRRFTSQQSAVAGRGSVGLYMHAIEYMQYMHEYIVQRKSTTNCYKALQSNTTETSSAFISETHYSNLKFISEIPSSTVKSSPNQLGTKTNLTLTLTPNHQQNMSCYDSVLINRLRIGHCHLTLTHTVWR